MRVDYFEMTQRAKKKYAHAMQPLCEKWDLTKNELDVLLFLHNNPAYDRAADIVARRGLTKSHVSLSLARLQTRGLVTTREDERDRRAVRLSLTGEAKAIAAQGRVIQDRFFGTIFDGLSPEDLQLWQTMVDRVCSNINTLEG